MAHIDPASVLIPLLILLIAPLFFFSHGVSSHRRFQPPGMGYCERLLWGDIFDSDILSDGKYRSLKDEHGKECWNLIFSEVFNGIWKVSKNRVQNGKLPKQLLQSQHRYLRIDLTVIYAIILVCAVEAAPKTTAFSNSIENGGVVIKDIQPLDEDDVTAEDDTNLVTAHIVKAIPRRPMAKLEIERILEGFPPWFYKDTFITDAQDQKHVLTHPIRDLLDLAHGGWIIALGLTNIAPLPLYYDHPWEVLDPFYDPDNFRTRRGGYFWQAIIHVRKVLQLHFIEAFPGESLIQTALARIDTLINVESADPSVLARVPFPGTSVSMTKEQCDFAIDTFSSPSDALTIRRFLGKVLTPVLFAAVSGVEKAFKYMETPGRELNSLIPMSMMDSQAIFLRDCEKTD